VAGLVDEHGDDLLVGSQMRVQALDGHRPGKADRAQEPPEVHGGHAAGRYDVVESIPPEDARPFEAPGRFVRGTAH